LVSIITVQVIHQKVYLVGEQIEIYETQSVEIRSPFTIEQSFTFTDPF